MKKSVLFALLAGASFMQANAQNAAPCHQDLSTQVTLDAENLLDLGNTAEKTTGTTQSFIFGTTAMLTPAQYSLYYRDAATPFDSGFAYGMNATNYKGSAQLFSYGSFNLAAPEDTTLQIIGFYTRFVGTKTQASASKTITLALWKRDAVKYAVQGRPKLFVYGLPQATPVATRTVTFANLSVTGTQVTLLTTPVNNVNYDVYAGYTLPTYTWPNLGGDTIGLAAVTAATNSASLEPVTLDTLVNARSIIMQSDGSWRSAAFHLGIGGDQIIIPVVKLVCANCANSINSITRNKLTFYGAYPNPATNNTTVRIALVSAADVTVEVMDMTGKTISTTKKTGLSSGEQHIAVNTADLPAGNYVYTVSTSNGDIVAAQLTIAK